MGEEKILGADDKKRDQSIVKVCETCGTKYHPRKNGYQTTSRFCSAECSRKSLKFNTSI
jgi:hypothetical protein